MTVSELIKELEAVADKSQRVILNGYEGGYCDVGAIEVRRIALDVNTESYYGPHEDADHLALTARKKLKHAEVVDAVRIRS